MRCIRETDRWNRSSVNATLWVLLAVCETTACHQPDCKLGHERGEYGYCYPIVCDDGFTMGDDGSCYQDTGAAEDDFKALTTPPDWMWQAQYLTVEPDRGWEFELDEEWALKGYTVPQLFLMPDGRFGMFATKMGPVEDPTSCYYGRSLLTSEDGLEWEDQGVLLWADDFPLECGNKLQDGAAWVRSADLYQVVMEGYAEQWQLDEDGNPFEPIANSDTYFVHTTTSDMVNFSPRNDYLFEPAVEGESNSVPSVVTLADGTGLFFYNGDLMSVTEAQQGIRVFSADPETLEVQRIRDEPILTPEQVDPNIVYVEGGGLRLYHTVFNTSMTPDSVPQYALPGIGIVNIGAGFQPTGDVAFAFQVEGPCPGSPTCYMDPSILRLADGTILLYATYTGHFGLEDQYIIGIRRAIAVD